MGRYDRAAEEEICSRFALGSSLFALIVWKRELLVPVAETTFVIRAKAAIQTIRTEPPLRHGSAAAESISRG